MEAKDDGHIPSVSRRTCIGFSTPSPQPTSIRGIFPLDDDAMTDSLSKEERSALMTKVRSKGNRSTELKALSVLEKSDIKGWVQHPSDLPGHPDFYFPDERLVVFIDGCFWHACPKCGRIPKTRVEFWKAKIEGNRRRDLSVTRALRKQGYHVMRVWEHALRDNRWVGRLNRMLGAHD